MTEDSLLFCCSDWKPDLYFLVSIYNAPTFPLGFKPNRFIWPRLFLKTQFINNFPCLYDDATVLYVLWKPGYFPGDSHAMPESHLKRRIGVSISFIRPVTELDFKCRSALNHPVSGQLYCAKICDDRHYRRLNLSQSGRFGNHCDIICCKYKKAQTLCCKFCN